MWIGNHCPHLADQGAIAVPYEAVKEYGGQGGDVQQAVLMSARGAVGTSMGYKVYVDTGGSGLRISGIIDHPFRKLLTSEFGGK